MKNIRILTPAIMLASILVTLSGCGGGSADGSSADNLPPLLDGKSPDYVRAGKNYSFTPTVMDPENDSLFFSIENKPDWAQFNNSTGELSGVPSELDVQQYDDVIVSVSDGVNTTSLPPFSLKVMYPAVGKKNVTIDPASTVTDTGNGYTVVGKASINVGGLDNELDNADLQFEYDSEGNLLNLVGDTDLPPVISNNLSLDGSVHAIVGMYTGAEINASMEIGPESDPGILLRDEFRYLVYFLDAGVDMSFHGKDGDEAISLSLAGTRTLIISDPTDPFFYYFGSVAGNELGFGYSFNLNIPYQPLFEADSTTAFAPLEPFLGQVVLKGAFPISAFKVFDVLEINGNAVCRPAQLVSCDKPTPVGLVSNLAQALILDGGIDSTQQIKLGINGGAGIKFAVLGIDLFEYHLLDVATMIDIGTRREHLAMQGVIETTTSTQPSWLPFKPVPDPNAIMVANLFADVDTQSGDGDFGVSLYGAIDSDFPLARMQGSIDINPQGMQMAGRIDDPENPITVSATVDADKLDANIRFSYDIQANIDQVVNNALDQALVEANQAFDDLQNAIGNYDVALSLDGFRSSIPAIVDQTKTTLDAIPGKVYSAVYSSTYNAINSASYTYTSPIGTKTTFYAKDYVSASGVASSSATSARSSAQSTVDARKAELDELKAQAQQTEDGPAFRTALKNALLTVISHDKFSQTVKVTRTISFKIAGVTVATRTFTFYNNTLSYTVIDASTKGNLQTAANNVDNIEPNYSVMINTQQIYDAIPKQQIIEETRSGVQNGSIAVPEFKGAGYTVTRDLDQSAYILLGQDKIQITFNPLDPVTVIENIGSVIVDQIIP